MDRKAQILAHITDLNGMINDTLNQLSELGDKVQDGSLTRTEAERFKVDWEQYVVKTGYEIQSLTQELLNLTNKCL